jgi:hypothetical protein
VYYSSPTRCAKISWLKIVIGGVLCDRRGSVTFKKVLSIELRDASFSGEAAESVGLTATLAHLSRSNHLSAAKADQDGSMKSGHCKSFSEIEVIARGHAISKLGSL